MMKKVLLTAVLVLALAACGGNGAEAATLAVTMKEFAFDPNPITVAAGTPVEITLMNDGTVEHDFVVEVIPVEDVVEQDMGMEGHMAGSQMDYDLHAAVPAGETSVLTFTPTQAGTYQIICSVPGHKEAGMVGELIVK